MVTPYFISRLAIATKFVNIESYPGTDKEVKMGSGLEIILQLAAAVVCIILSAIFVAFLMGMIIAVYRTIKEEKDRNK